MKKKLVIICTIAYNAEKTIERAINSVLNQTYDNFHYYIMENGSTDNTRKIIMDYAKKDKRIIPKYFDVNIRGRMYSFFYPYATLKYDDNFSVLLDADDEYKPNFLEKMFEFVNENNLEFATCGSDKIDAITGKLIERKSLDYNLIFTKEDYAEKFLIFRRFLTELWGKFIYIPVIKKNILNYFKYPLSNNFYSNKTAESSHNNMILKNINRAGVIKGSLHKYYIFSNSSSKTFNKDRFKIINSTYHMYKTFLLEYGEISKINQDYLYAIYLGNLQHEIKVLKQSNYTFSEKLQFIQNVFDDKITKEMLSCNPDPQFKNLSHRDEFVQDIKNYVITNGGELNV